MNKLLRLRIKSVCSIRNIKIKLGVLAKINHSIQKQSYLNMKRLLKDQQIPREEKVLTLVPP